MFWPVNNRAIEIFSFIIKFLCRGLVYDICYMALFNAVDGYLRLVYVETNKEAAQQPPDP